MTGATSQATNAARGEQPRGGGAAGVVARERRLVERPGHQVEAHAERDQREPQRP